ncbi:MAG: type III pantothenate kinase [candidate division Zixibacteria bacterium]|nr:type III pantothenate kinase [candidate division Zixibacteria bacterium]
MLLALDIGNSSIVVGLFERQIMITHSRFVSRRDISVDEATRFLEDSVKQCIDGNSPVEKAVIGSVVPQLTPVFENAIQNLFKCRSLVVSSLLRLPVTLVVSYPEQLGADRIANVVAGFIKYGGVGKPLIIVDFGTATKIEAITEDGKFLGGVIFPGIETSMTALTQKAAKLFEIKFEPTENVIGKSTTDALTSGLFHGTVGQVDYLIERIIAEAAFQNPIVIATGGLSSGFETYSRHITRVDPFLTLDGLRLIAEYK